MTLNYLHKALYTFLPLGLNTFNWKLDLSDGENSIQYHAICLSHLLISKVRIEQIIRLSFVCQTWILRRSRILSFFETIFKSPIRQEVAFCIRFSLIDRDFINAHCEGGAMVRVDRKSPLSESVKHMYECVG